MKSSGKLIRVSFVSAVMILSASFAAAQEKSVNPNINKSFQKPDVATFVERFEGEGREIYDQREAIVAACGIKPGMTVADVGAGTGLFTRLFAKKTGSTGKVFAVDIAKEFIDHIDKTCEQERLTNVEGIVCKQDDSMLPPNSVDLVFICDTYHHFEFPQKTMASIHRALRPGGQLIVIDFQRVEGVSSEWVLNHVRAGQETFTKEIIAAGFKQTEEKKLLEDNYFLRFEKVMP